MNAEEDIRRLKKDLKEYQQSLKEINEVIKNLKTDNLQALHAKEKEIQDLNAKLQVCQQKRDEIQQELDSKIEEIKNSNLTSENKAQQVTNLLVEHKKELDLVNQELAKAWSSCANQKDQIIRYLTQSCKTCEHHSQTVADLTYVRNWLIGAVSFLLILLSRSWLPKKHQKKFKK